MSLATGSSEAAGGAGGGGARVFFQSPRGGAAGSPGSSSGAGSSREDSAPVAPAAGQVQQQQQQQRRHQQGKVTVKYDRKELRKRLVLEEWIVEQLGRLYGCEVTSRFHLLCPPCLSVFEIFFLATTCILAVTLPEAGDER
ncbi:protein phosphatase 1 regulatory subunit 14C isoform X2 [Myotis daubentonii]|uniref:protein phosphatase 1 regulatory subunit 14C isoform X2 n=1 Tax=Myotis daubentonii TaxID=98922 RepID=UPI0028730C11|nr:protein phosphatase 1 regulatory subunit 14C isoform X2 [Myotis daubentonii]